MIPMPMVMIVMAVIMVSVDMRVVVVMDVEMLTRSVQYIFMQVSRSSSVVMLQYRGKSRLLYIRFDLGECNPRRLKPTDQEIDPDPDDE